MEALTPPASGLEGGEEEDAIARYVFSIPAEEYWPSTSAYIWVKVFKKTILAKMLIDSGTWSATSSPGNSPTSLGSSMSQRGIRWAPQQRGGA